MTTPAAMPAAPERVRDAFARFAGSIARKEGIPLPRIRCREAASAAFPDGSVATLWVGTAEGARSACYHVDVSTPDGQHSAGFGSCQLPGNSVDLARHGTLVIGSTGMRAAVSAQVSTRLGEARVPVASGHFMVPPELAPDASVELTIRLLDAHGTPVGEVTGMTAPGSSVL